jgi:hypothetical protein
MGTCEFCSKYTQFVENSGECLDKVGTDYIYNENGIQLIVFADFGCINFIKKVDQNENL